MSEATDAIIRAQDLSHQVQVGEETLTLLSDINLSVAAGESVAILGRSGSGKTTLLGLLAGLDLPTAGTVDLAGERISAMDEDSRARHRANRVGFVFQSFQLLPTLSALENVLLPLELGDVRDASDRARELLERVGLGERLGHTPRQLSGGEQQRVAIARAFAANPAVLFADEPTGNLDTTTGQQIADLLMALNAEQGTTLVLVTHDEELAGRCDRRIRMDGGRLLDATTEPSS
ncbi:ABC transporter ATP-binding protein [Vreelandella utahensis]|uniref:ABC transporter ATP-binding protein n=1 Tax=Vreelandella halophila TaxID=86177 RepID=UPI0009862418|nr:ABC transporter ATP-binding protein [Halomonas utahensis]